MQIIEFKTSRIDEIQALDKEWEEATEGRRTAAAGTLTQDRDNPGTYLQIVEFPSYEAAMENSGMPETGSFAERMMKLCDGPAVFRNLDVVERIF
jgi:hypothetical protein